jgi:hypothetical protein
MILLSFGDQKAESSEGDERSLTFAAKIKPPVREALICAI